MKNYPPAGMKYRETTGLLGMSFYTSKADNDSIFITSYEVEVKHRYGDIDPYEMIWLEIFFSVPDSLLIKSELQ